jgi:outer membrane lipoprotein SlyB
MPRRVMSEGLHPVDEDHVDTSQPGHADTGSAAGVGGVTGAAIGAAAGPIGAAIGAVGGIIVGAAAERAMHVDDDARAERTDPQRPTLDIDHGDTVVPPPPAPTG